MTPPIIHHPERQGRRRRTVFTVLTATAWALYFYLWLPLITLLAWVLGVRSSYGELYLKQHAVDPFLLLALPVIALVCAIVLLAWAEYNRARFGGEERRKAVDPVDADAVALALGADAATAASLRGGRSMTLALDEHARPSSALPRPPAPARLATGAAGAAAAATVRASPTP
jgi:biofilm PGA synthesis protein PgaD